MSRAARSEFLEAIRTSKWAATGMGLSLAILAVFATLGLLHAPALVVQLGIAVALAAVLPLLMVWTRVRARRAALRREVLKMMSSPWCSNVQQQLRDTWQYDLVSWGPRERLLIELKSPWACGLEVDWLWDSLLERSNERFKFQVAQRLQDLWPSTVLFRSPQYSMLVVLNPERVQLGDFSRARIRKQLAAERAARRAERSFNTLSSFLPKRLCNEEIGDALEDITRRVREGQPVWQLYAKMLSTWVWVLWHGLWDFVGHMTRALTGQGESKDT